jgi:hypothetical protein
MAGLNVEFVGLDRWLAAMRGAPKVLETEMVGATNRLTLQGVSVAQSHAAVDTGHMRRSIVNKPATFGGGVVRGEFGTNARSAEGFPYPIAIEKGRRGFGPVRARVLAFVAKGGEQVFARYVGPAAAQPFMKPALDHLRPLVPREFRAALQRALARIR